METRPLFDRLEVRSVHWDYPDWVLSVHADELESLKRRYMAGELDQWFFESPPPAKRKRQWPHLRATRFKAQLAQAHHPESRGLYFDDGSESGGWFNEGEIMLREANCEGHVANHELDRIAFRADFHHLTTGETATIYLSGCARDCLKLEEREARKDRRRESAAKAGVCSLRLGGDPDAARAIKRHLKERWRSLGDRGLAKAIRELKQGDWLDKNYPDVAPIVRKLSDSTLRNLVTGQTGLMLTRRFKRSRG